MTSADGGVEVAFADEATDHNDLLLDSDRRVYWKGDDMSRLSFYSWPDSLARENMSVIEDAVGVVAAYEHAWPESPEKTGLGGFSGPQDELIVPEVCVNGECADWAHVKSQDIGLCSVPIGYQPATDGDVALDDWILFGEPDDDGNPTGPVTQGIATAVVETFPDVIDGLRVYKRCSEAESSEIQGRDFEIEPGAPDLLKFVDFSADSSGASWWQRSVDFEDEICFRLEYDFKIRVDQFLNCNWTDAWVEFCGRVTDLVEVVSIAQAQYPSDAGMEDLMNGSPDEVAAYNSIVESAGYNRMFKIRDDLFFGRRRSDEMMWATTWSDSGREQMVWWCRDPGNTVVAGVEDIVSAWPEVNLLTNEIQSAVNQGLRISSYIAASEASLLGDSSTYGLACTPTPRVVTQEQIDDPSFCQAHQPPQGDSGQSETCKDEKGLIAFCNSGECDLQVPVARVEVMPSSMELVLVEEEFEGLNMEDENDVRVGQTKLWNTLLAAGTGLGVVYAVTQDKHPLYKFITQQCAERETEPGVFSFDEPFRASEYYFRGIQTTTY